MAARRLIIVMIVLLAISTAVAVIAPQPAERRESETTEATVPEPEDPSWYDEAGQPPKESVIYSDARSPKRIVARVGDRLRLEVEGAEGRQIAIPSLGLAGTQSRTAPARFELYFDSPGEHDVIDAQSEEKLSQIVVKEALSAGSEPELKSGESEPPAASPQAKDPDQSRS